MLLASNKRYSPLFTERLRYSFIAKYITIADGQREGVVETRRATPIAHVHPTNARRQGGQDAKKKN